jgi:hypothetical protein
MLTLFFGALASYLLGSFLVALIISDSLDLWPLNPILSDVGPLNPILSCFGGCYWSLTGCFSISGFTVLVSEYSILCPELVHFRLFRLFLGFQILFLGFLYLAFICFIMPHFGAILCLKRLFRWYFELIW